MLQNLPAAESHVSGLRISIAAMLQQHMSLEIFYTRKSWEIIKAEDYIVLIPALQGNHTLKTLKYILQWKASVDRRRRQRNGRAAYEKRLFGKSSRYRLGE
jgi:hypothetical protein